MLPVSERKVQKVVSCCPVPKGTQEAMLLRGGVMLSSAQRNSRSHVAEELLLQMFQQSLWAMLSLRVKLMGERPCCPLPNGKCKSWC